MIIEVLAFVMSLSILIFFGIIWLIIFIINWTYARQTYDVIIEVQSVEHSTRFGEHTNLWAKVYGEQDITYELKGYHDFVIGHKYRLKFKNELFLFGLIVRGNVISIEELE